MAQQTIESLVDVYWVDSATKINANFTELYAKPGAATTATAAELNYLDITTLGVGANLKAVVPDSGGDYKWPDNGIFQYFQLKDADDTLLTATL